MQPVCAQLASLRTARVQRLRRRLKPLGYLVPVVIHQGSRAPRQCLHGRRGPRPPLAVSVTWRAHRVRATPEARVSLPTAASVGGLLMASK